jgi:hypothetical protein
MSRFRRRLWGLTLFHLTKIDFGLKYVLNEMERNVFLNMCVFLGTFFPNAIGTNNENDE